MIWKPIMHADPNAIETFLKLLVQPGAVFEIRALKVKQEYGRPAQFSGYYDYEHISKAAEDVVGLGEAPGGVYVTLNPVKPAVMARRACRIERADTGETTSDHEVESRTTLLIDSDPDRPSGICATDAEHEAALALSARIVSDLTAAGWPEPVSIDSGNGGQLWYRISLPAEDGELVTRTLAALGKKYDSTVVHIDQTVFNPSRIGRLPGTMNRKGDNTTDRPHRMARVLSAPASLVPVPIELLEALAGPASAPTPNAVQSKSTAWTREAVQQFIDDNLSDCGPGAPTDYRGGTKWVLEKCPFDESHTGGCAAVFHSQDGVPGFRCQHDSCLNHHWRGLMAKFGVDNRSTTSAVNGQGGGRPPCTKDIADGFIASQDAPFPLKKHRGAWYAYDGKIYVPISTDDLKGRVMLFLRNNRPDYATRNMTANVMENLHAADVAGVESRFPMPCWLPSGDPAAGWMAMKNGLVNIENLAALMGGKQIQVADVVRAHTPTLFSTLYLPYVFNADAACPKWKAYLEGVQPDPAMRDLLQMLAGLALVPDTSYEVFFILFGEAGCGKTVFLYVLEHLVGSQNVCVLPLSKFGEKHSTHLLTENLLNIVGDLPTNDGRVSLHMIEGILKDVTSGGLLSCERKNQEPYKAPAIARCVFATNSLPTFADRTNGVWDRLRIVPFDIRFRGTARQNPQLKEEIVEAELPGVFLWAVEGLAKLRKLRQFPRGPRGEQIEAQHRADCDHEAQFLKDRYVEYMGAFTQSQLMYTTYRTFCSNSGYHPKNLPNFSTDVRRVFPSAVDERRRVEDGRQVRGFLNLSGHLGAEGQP